MTVVAPAYAHAVLVSGCSIASLKQSGQWHCKADSIDTALGARMGHLARRQQDLFWLRQALQLHQRQDPSAHPMFRAEGMLACAAYPFPGKASADLLRLDLPCSSMRPCSASKPSRRLRSSCSFLHRALRFAFQVLWDSSFPATIAGIGFELEALKAWQREMWG